MSTIAPTDYPPPAMRREPSAAADELGAADIHLWWVTRRRTDARKPLLDLLGAYLGIAPDTVMLDIDTHGRPTLATVHAAALDFNWSHSGGYALIAIARHLPRLGVDLEFAKPGRACLAIAKRYFAAREHSVLFALSEPARAAAFTRLWTAKEALLKAHGGGLAFGLDRATFDVLDDGLRLRGLDPALGVTANWQLAHWPVGNAGFASLCWQGPPRSIHHFAIPDATLDATTRG